MPAGRRKELKLSIVLTCEHAANQVPRDLEPRFVNAAAVRALASHRGWDPGAFAVARRLSRRFRAPLFAATWSRLVVDLNRSEHNRAIFSEFTCKLPPEAREAILATHYRPHRRKVEQAVRQRVAGGRRVLHLGIHSFTPRLRGVTRGADLALLYDPGRRNERAFCARWTERIRERDSDLRVRRNYPYRGSADGLTTYLRKRFPGWAYLGIEVEMNQRLLGDAAGIGRLEAIIGRTLADLAE